jgi:hypothetical protein
MENHRQNLVRLASATKDYSPLTIHIWRRRGSKSGWQHHGAELVDGITKTILTKPDEKWLVVHHKADSRVPDVPTEVTKFLPPGVAGGVSFTHWGRHQASNEWAGVPYVILAGTLFMRPSMYTALTHLAQGKPAGDHRLPDEDIQKTTVGEHKDLLLQAICRGRVRKLNGNRCLPMHAYVIATPMSGIPAALRDVFPGCRVERWQPVEKRLTGKLAEAIHVLEQLAGVGISPITYRTIRDHINVKDVSNWRKQVATREEWAEAVANNGYVITTLTGGNQGLTMLPEDFLVE